MKETLNILTNIISCAFYSEKNVSIGEEADWEEIYIISKAHNVANIVCYALDRLKLKIPEEIYKKFKSEQLMAVRRDAIQGYEIKKLLDKYEENEIDCVALKGFVLKSMFPSPDMRIMGDLDLLLKRDRLLEAHEIILENGYTEIVEENQDKETNPHEEYKKPPVMLIELHKFLFPKEGFKDIFEYYEGVWERLLPLDGYKHIYRMNNEEFYVYMILHIMKHYKLAGTGIRSILDIWVFLKNTDIDHEYTDSLLERFGMIKFERHIRNLCGIWFEQKQNSDVFYEEMSEYIVQSGTYGTEKNFKSINILETESASGVKYLLKLVFLPYKSMCMLYPSLNKFPPALPFYWIFRIADRIINKKGKLKNELEISADAQYREKMKKHFENLGL